MFTPPAHNNRAVSAPAHGRARLVMVLVANGLLRSASGASGALVGFYLAFLARQGEAVDPALVGTIGVVANVAELVGAVPLGMLADRYTPRTVLV
jgi:MFS family permease